MARQKVITLNADSAIALKDVGTFNGYYVGTKKCDTGFDKPSSLHVFQTDAGSVGVWGFARLDEQLLAVPKGSMTWLQYQGVGKSHKKGFKPPQLASVEFDAAIAIDVAGVELQTEAVNEPDYSTATDAVDGAAEDDTADVVEDAPLPAPTRGAPRAANPAQQAKVQAALDAMKNRGSAQAKR